MLWKQTGADEGEIDDAEGSESGESSEGSDSSE
jgi:hypothetical protein